MSGVARSNSHRHTAAGKAEHCERERQLGLGWMTGYIFDVTGSYQAAFVNGLGWNAVNGMIVLWLLYRRRSRLAFA